MQTARFSLAALLAIALTFALLPGTQALHRDGNLHGDEDRAIKPQATLWLNCNRNTEDGVCTDTKPADDGDVEKECDLDDTLAGPSGESRGLCLNGEAPPGNGDESTEEPLVSTGTGDEEVTRTFVFDHHGRSGFTWDRDFSLSGADPRAYLFFTGQGTQWDFTIELIRTGDDQVLADRTRTGIDLNDQRDNQGNQTGTDGYALVSFDLTITDADLPAGQNLKLQITATYTAPPTPNPNLPQTETRSLSLWIGHSESGGGDERSRIELDGGTLLHSNGWTHDINDIPRSAFSVDVPNDQREIHATYVIDSAFGSEILDRSSALVRATLDGNPVDMREGEAGRQDSLPLEERAGFTTDTRIVHRMERPWTYPDDTEAGGYELDYVIGTNDIAGDYTIERTTGLVIGAGIGLDIGDNDTLEVRPGENATFSVIVRNRGVSALDIDLTPTGVASTWSAALDQTRIVLQPEEERNVTLQVRPPDDAANGTEETVDVRAEAIGRPDISIERISTTTRSVDELRLGARFEALTDLREEVAPGKSGSIEVEVVNNGTVRDTYQLQRGRLPSGWTANVSIGEVTLDPGERQEVSMTVQTRGDEEDGETFNVSLEAISLADRGIVESVDLVVETGTHVDYSVQIQGQGRDLRPGGEATFRLAIRSQANIRERFTFTGTHPDVMILDPGAIGEVETTVDTSACGSAGDEITKTISIESVSSIEADRDVTVRGVCLGSTDHWNRLLVEAREASLFRQRRFGDTVSNAHGAIAIVDKVRANAGQPNVRLPVRVTNLGTQQVDVSLSIPKKPAGWNVSLTKTSIADPGIDPANGDLSASAEDRADCGWTIRGNFFSSALRTCVSARLVVDVPPNASAGKHEIEVAASTKTTDPSRASASRTYIVEVVAHRDATIRAPVTDQEVAPDRAAIFPVVLENRGNVESEFDVDVNTSGLPRDWTVRHGPTELVIPGVSSRYVAFEIIPPADAEPGDTGTVNLTLTSDFDFFPLSESELSLDVTVRGASDIVMSTSPRESEIKPNSSATFNVTLRNTGSSRSTVGLTLSPMPDDFSVQVSRPNGSNVSLVTVDPGETLSLEIRIDVPPDVLAGAQVGSVLTARASGAANVATTSVKVTVLKTFGVQLQAERTELITPAGEEISHRITVTNTGTAKDSFILGTASQAKPGWTTAASRASVTLRPRTSQTFLFNVVPSPNVEPDTTLRSVVQAVSKGDPDRESRITLETTTLLRRVGFARQNTTVAAAPGETVTAGPVVKNLGNDVDRLKLEVVDLPEGWTAEAGGERQIPPATTDRLPIDVTPPDNVSQGIFGVQLRVLSDLDPSVSSRGTLLVRIAEFAASDVDDDGFEEFAVDRNDLASDGFESFAEIRTGTGVQTQVVHSGDFGGRVRTGYLVQVREEPQPTFRFWNPDENVVSEVITGFVLRPDSRGFAVDVDDDGIVDAMYDERQDAVLDAVSLSDRDGFVLDGDDDGEFDRFHSTSRGLTTTATPYPGGEVAVDSNGDGRFDVLVDEETGRARTFTAMDASTQAAVRHPILVILIVASVVLAPVAYLVRREEAIL